MIGHTEKKYDINCHRKSKDLIKKHKRINKFSYGVTSKKDLKIEVQTKRLSSAKGSLRRRLRLKKMSKPKMSSSQKKVSLEKFESRFSEKDSVFYIESTQNINGNYFNYVSNVLKNLQNFDLIDFIPAIMKKSIYLEHSSKKSLFIDLDETLVHADFCYFFKKHDCYLEFLYEKQSVTIPLILRPYLIEFLDFCCDHFDLYIFTASRKEYADCIIDHIEKDKKYFLNRFYRDNCIIIKNRVFIKDLRIFLNRDLKDVIIIDNSLFSFTNQLSNGILITSFYYDPNDKELINLKNYLSNMRLAYVEDVRTINKKVFNFENIKEKL